MAMTKKEKAAFDEAIKRANTLAALRWTEPAERDLPAPEWGKPNTTGFDFNAYSIRIDQMWSEASAHGYGLKRSDSAYQNSRSLYSTKLLAMRAMRHAVELESAEKLRRIDEMIAQELLQNNPVAKGTKCG